VSDRDELLHRFYADAYSQLAVTAGDTWAARYTHRLLEKRFGPEVILPRVLELGGNRGEHVPFVRHAFDEYHLTDLRMPQPLPSIATDPRIRVREVDAASTPFADRTFDRVITTCLLHHVPDPTVVAQEMRRVTRPGGVISILLPTDPGLAYRTSHWLTSGRIARRRGMAEDWRLVHAMDHPNHFRSIALQLRAVFRHDDVRTSWLPAHLRSVELNVFTIWQITVR
jgi:phosphatidylethanolamine/phosphatidyl-N-methylethanolamine N-methyltransferase